MMVMLWLDDARVGCGWRPYVVLSEGRKRVHVFQPSSLIHLNLSVEEYRAAKGPQSLTERPSRWARLIRRRLRENQRMGLHAPEAYAREAIGVLEEMR